MKKTNKKPGINRLSLIGAHRHNDQKIVINVSLGCTLYLDCSFSVALFDEEARELRDAITAALRNRKKEAGK